MIIHQKKLLVVQIMDNGLYCLPGGHCNIGENTVETIKREIMEETSIRVKEVRLNSIVENFFTRSNRDVVHELSFIYSVRICADTNKELFEDRVVYEEDEDGMKKLEFKWIPINDIDKWNVKPNIIKDIINEENINHFIIDNGEIVKL